MNLLTIIAICTAINRPPPPIEFFDAAYQNRLDEIAMREVNKAQLSRNIEFLTNHGSRRFDYKALADQYTKLRDNEARLRRLKHEHNTHMNGIL